MKFIDCTFGNWLAKKTYAVRFFYTRRVNYPSCVLLLYGINDASSSTLTRRKVRDFVWKHVNRMHGILDWELGQFKGKRRKRPGKTKV